MSSAIYPKHRSNIIPVHTILFARSLKSIVIAFVSKGVRKTKKAYPANALGPRLISRRIRHKIIITGAVHKKWKN